MIRFSRISFFLGLVLLALSACNQPGAQKEKPVSDSTGHTNNRPQKTILFFGNSLTAGYGLEDPSLAFPALVQAKIDSLHLPYRCMNAGLSGETTTGGKNRLGWLLKNKVDIFVLELGANDGLRGIPLDQSRTNLQNIIDQVRGKYPDVKMLLCGMLVPPNMGASYSNQFRDIFPALAKKNKMELIPFLLQGVAGKPALNQADGIHPTEAGEKIVVENVWAVLKKML